jgi:HAD superfamily hydrolase (TIGR01509 family)
MSRFELVIFDCDGVLVDSERLANEILAEMLRDLGLGLTLADMFEHFVGRSTQQCMEKISQLLGRPAPPQLFPAYRARVEAAFVSGLEAIPGIARALDLITLPCCVASNGSRTKMRQALGATGLLPRFEGKIFSAEEVGRPKPAPDVFLHAASRFGVAPARCVVVEDTPIGVAAAAGAGMCPLGYAGLIPKASLEAAGAQCTFEQMADLPGLLAQLGGPPDDSSRSPPLCGVA